MFISYSFLHLLVQSFYLRSVLSKEQKEIVVRTFFPKKHNRAAKDKRLYLKKLQEELDIKKGLINLEFKDKKNINLDNNLELLKFSYLKGFNTGIDLTYPGSGYIDFADNNLVILSARGILAVSDLGNSEFIFKQIKNNINDFIGLNQFKKHKRFSIKDLHISNRQIFVSYIEEVKKDCWNTSLLIGDFSYKNIKFRKLFSSKKCIHSIENENREFNSMQSGGRIIDLDTKNIAFTTGEFRSRSLAQDFNSINGKVIKINTDTGKYDLISIGHRNPQGLLYDKEKEALLITEHGPAGGDEINLISLKNTKKPLNYGWPISSYGNHYSDKLNLTRKIKYSFIKSHVSEGFVEPLKYYTPSIGPSEIVKIDNSHYIFSTLADKNLYFFKLGKNNEYIFLNKVNVGERVRDMKFRNKKLYLFLENSASLGIINF